MFSQYASRFLQQSNVRPAVANPQKQQTCKDADWQTAVVTASRAWYKTSAPQPLGRPHAAHYYGELRHAIYENELEKFYPHGDPTVGQIAARAARRVDSLCVDFDFPKEVALAVVSKALYDAYINGLESELLEDFDIDVKNSMFSSQVINAAGAIKIEATNVRKAGLAPMNSSETNETPSSKAQYRRRRGRGQRRNEAYWKEFNSKDAPDPFDSREVLFSNTIGEVVIPALANLDTGLKIPGGLVMSLRYAIQLGRYHEISFDFVDPCMRSVSGHRVRVYGVLRNVVFRLRGTSVTFMRNFFICEALDDMIDIMFGANFIKDQFKLLFEKIKEFGSAFAAWFSTKKESADEQEERKRREREQEIKANELESARLRKAEEEIRLAAKKSRERKHNPQSPSAGTAGGSWSS